ncbi:hypothetical protein NZD89_08905 [Alicyclobacillus fastidiosus]|uniref:Core-binding (CB) domain-containing protein n=1 Tax=Alicyclobacillus fastidiosus TaxID=392011 RepID=A0ABY6ZMZ1_9BACL|nr:hypothetical protein [Alicyclobacillus fastidiosus]WAH43481.1 hypothetical protein NZD89_08905 [Alicyclobacillus fastidiosus]GMA59644.1 hypothetical protein GCM10025859_00840 [Alicyclobacillus fastidiosus]
MNLSQASEAFLTVRGQEGFSPFTIRAYRQQHKLLMRDIGDIQVEDVTLSILRNHLSHNELLKPSSLGHKIRAIKSLFDEETQCLYIITYFYAVVEIGDSVAKDPRGSDRVRVFL